MLDHRLSFEPASHSYFHSSRKLNSVTEILRETGIYSDYKFLAPEYRERGRFVHVGCRLIDVDDYTERGTSPVIVPFLRSYMTFVKRTGFKGIAWEVGMANPLLNVGGYLDVIGTPTKLNPDELWLVDIKSGTCPKMVGAQVAGYEWMFKSGALIPSPDLDAKLLTTLQDIRDSKRVLKRKSLNLTPDRDNLRSYDEGDWPAIWMAALTLFNGRKKYGML